MKISELKRIAEAHDCYLREEDGVTFIKYGDNIVAAIDNELCCVLNTVWRVPTTQYDELKPVITAAVEYAMTPIEDRKEVELFYVRYTRITDVGNEDDLVYINYNLDEEAYEVNSCSQVVEFKTQFTPKEIEAMPESIRQAIRKGVLEVIEVSDVDG